MVPSLLDGADPGGMALTTMISKPGLFPKYGVEHFPMLLPWEVAMVCGVNKWDSVSESCDDQSDTSLHALYADYLNQLFSTAKDNTRVRGQLSAMFRSDPQLLLNTLAVLLHLDGIGQQQTDASSGCSAPRYGMWVNGSLCFINNINIG